MRKYTRDQARELLGTIRSGLKYVGVASAEDALAALANCHAIASVTEQSLMADLDVVRAVHYRQLMYTLTKSIEDAMESVPRRTARWEGMKRVKEQLTIIERELDNEPEIRTEIAFMPIFAEQWAALDSIWRAAKPDRRCECTVIPLPYYLRTAEGRLGRKIYEGRSFPDYLQIVHYEKFNLPKKKPDVIYIQNADDDSSDRIVLPECYFTGSLKQNTGKLVYVPPELTLSPGNSRCAAPGLEKVSIAIAQSEEERRNYPYLSTRTVFALGSPLVDHVLDYNMKHRRLPEQWEDIIGNRRIVLMCTNPDILGSYGETYIQKLEQIIGIFEGRPDIALVWRSGGIPDSAYGTISSHTIRNYRALISAYKESGIGVFDDTPDLCAALAAADAFLGDRSESMILFGLAGKPMMLQYVDLYTSPPTELTFENAGSYASEDAYAYIFHESPVCRIPDFLNYVVRCDGKPNRRQTDAFRTLASNSDGTSGMAIHNAVMNAE